MEDILLLGIIVLILILIIRAIKRKKKLKKNDTAFVEPVKEAEEVAEEDKVMEALRMLPDEYTCISDLTISSLNNGLIEIDKILFSPYGIFIISEENRSGKVLGSREKPIWAELNGDETKEFNNPFEINYSNMRAIQETLGIPFRYLVSIVVFTGDARIPDIERSLPLDEHIVFLKELDDCIAYYKKTIMSEEQSFQYGKKLQENHLGDNKSLIKQLSEVSINQRDYDFRF